MGGCRRIGQVFLLAMASGCASLASSETADPTSDAPFAGIASASWDGEDGLTATWEGGGEGIALEVLDAGGAFVMAVEAAGGSATASGLADGEYVLRVVSADGQDGARSLHQWVGPDRLVSRSHAAIPGGGRTIEGSGGLVAVGGGTVDNGQVLLYDLSGGPTATPLGVLSDLGEVSDVAIQGELLAVATDTTLHPEEPYGVRFYDITDPSAPLLVGAIDATADNAHTLTFGEAGIVYLASTLNGWIAAYDVSDPAHPESLGPFRLPQPSMPHDQTWVDGRLWMAYTTGLAVADTSNPGELQLLGVLPATWSNPFVHNLWPTADGRSLAVSEEAVGGSLRIVDIESLTEMAVLAQVETAPEHSIHNVVVRGNYSFAAWYTDGVLVFDLSEPTAPVLVGQVDTWAGSEAVENRADGSQWPNVNGATHVWPMGRHIAASDSALGLAVFDFFPPTINWGESWGGNEGA